MEFRGSTQPTGRNHITLGTSDGRLVSDSLANIAVEKYGNVISGCHPLAQSPISYGRDAIWWANHRLNLLSSFSLKISKTYEFLLQCSARRFDQPTNHDLLAPRFTMLLYPALMKTHQCRLFKKKASDHLHLNEQAIIKPEFKPAQGVPAEQYTLSFFHLEIQKGRAATTHEN